MSLLAWDALLAVQGSDAYALAAVVVLVFSYRVAQIPLAQPRRCQYTMRHLPLLRIGVEERHLRLRECQRLYRIPLRFQLVAD